ncbi:hypothetical protein Hanom_Chr10g00888581 [Helianthus anomalus]
MIESVFAEGKPVWLDQIRDRFLHPSSDSFAVYANTILGEDDGDELDDTVGLTREEVIVLSSEGSDKSREGLIPRSPRAGPAQGAVNEPVNEAVDVDVDLSVGTAEQLETRKKKKVDRSEKKEKKVEEKVTEVPRKRPSTLHFLDYVVVSDTLSGLGAGGKRAEHDPEDDETLTEIVKKRKVLEEKKKELDEQAAAAFATKRAKLQKEALPAPSESEIDMGIFSAKPGNLLEEIYIASGSRGVKSGKGPHKIDISKITPPTSPPFRAFDLSPPHVEKKKQDDAEVEQVGEGGVTGGAGGDGRGKGVETMAESSDATPRHTIYTRRPLGSGGGVTSGVPRIPEFANVQAGSWDTHNPACDDLLHAPRWKLTQGSWMNDHDNCREFFSLSLPPAERLFQKRRNRFDLLDDHIHVGVNFFATSQEIVREWKLMGEDTLEFENAKKTFAEEMEKFNAWKKGLLWRVSDTKQKLAQEKHVNSNKQKEWEVACERTNKELQAQREAIVRMSGEKRKISDEAEQERVAHQKREREYVERIAKLEKFVEEKITENKASEILAGEMSADSNWLLTRAVPLISEHIAKSDELAKYMFDLGQEAYNSGRKDGYGEGRAAAMNNEKDYHFELFKEDCTAKYVAKLRDYEFVEFGIVKAVEKLSHRGNDIEVLKKALGDSGPDGGETGPSHQD